MLILIKFCGAGKSLLEIQVTTRLSKFNGSKDTESY